MDIEYQSVLKRGLQMLQMQRYLFMLLLMHFFQYSSAQHQGNGKKVYADYHGTRYSRGHDGMLGRWPYYGLSEKSTSPLKLMCYNADNILENGENQIAAVHYPLTGVQSNLDPDFIEFQILSAKTAKIDGFFIEWGFPEHESTLLLTAFRNVAAKYNFEIGVNWCDGWLYYDWITKLRPDIKTREDKTKHFITSFQYLIDSVFSTVTAPTVNGIPVYYLFGGGISNEEYKNSVLSAAFKVPMGMRFPQGLRRVAEWGTIADGKYRSADLTKEFEFSKSMMMSPTAWIPARVRARDTAHPLWDNYATAEDVFRFMEPFKQHVWEQPGDGIPIKCGFVTPGMDNRGCGGWGRGHFFYISRDSGKLYRDFWNYNLNYKDSLNAIFIASWSDYTEGHEIEPTIQNGYRELLTTLHGAAAFKNEKYTEEGIYLPIQLFELRKNAAFLKNTGIKIYPQKETMDSIGQFISAGNYQSASTLLSQEQSMVEKLKKSIKSRDYATSKNLRINGRKNNALHVLKDSSIYITFDNTLRRQLMNTYYDGYIYFEYLDTGKLNTTTVYSHTTHDKKEFGIVGEIRTANTDGWKKAKIKLIHSNIDLSSTYNYNASFLINGNVPLRNIRLDFITYRIPK